MKIAIIIITTICLLTPSVEAQTVDTAQLKADYSNLIKKEESMKMTLDSLQKKLLKNRTVFDSDAGANDSISSEIIQLESLIFDTRSALSRVGTQIAMLEAEIAKYGNLSNIDNTQKKTTTYKNLLQNEFFVTNISAKERQLFATTDRVISNAKMIKLSVDSLYTHLQALKNTFDGAQSQDQIDTTIIEAALIKKRIATLDKQIENQWNGLYNTKLDNYLILVDKLGGADRNTLESLDLLSREALHMQTIGESSLAPTLTALKSQQELINAYEKLLAEKLKLTSSIDSLKTVALKLHNETQASYDDIEFPYRSMVLYAPITLGNKYDFTDINETPILKIPKRGAYYSVQVALVTGVASSLNIFKGAMPLQVEKISGGQSRYVLGGFKTYDEGMEAVKQCYSAGFKNPVLVAWVNGTYSTPAKAKAYQNANPNESSGADFKIEIITDNGSITSVLKNTIDLNAPGKTITRTEENGVYTYTITQFPTREEAQVIMQIIQTKEPALTKINVSPL